MVRRIPTKQRNPSVTRDLDQSALIRLVLLLVCGLALAGGFVYAGGRHFASLKFGYETENLRRMRHDLDEEHRRLLLERDAAASPARLERAARQLGMQAMQPAQIDPLKRIAKGSTEKNPANLRETEKSRSGSGQAIAPAGNAQTNRIRNKPI